MHSSCGSSCKVLGERLECMWYRGKSFKGIFILFSIQSRVFPCKQRSEIKLIFFSLELSFNFDFAVILKSSFKEPAIVFSHLVATLLHFRMEKVSHSNSTKLIRVTNCMLSYEEYLQIRVVQSLAIKCKHLAS